MTEVPVRVMQLSDTHFLADGAEPEGGFSYDTDAAFAAVRDHHLASHGQAGRGIDLVAVTGDVADWGHPMEYAKAATALAGLGAPVNACPGNHDRDLPFTVALGRPHLGTSRVVRSANWCFLFVDSNAGVMVPDGTGRAVDPDDHGERLHRNGTLGEREAAWLAEAATAAAVDADHLFVWVHHPPFLGGSVSGDVAYDAEWRELLPSLPNLRGIGGGHTHVPGHHRSDGVDVFVCPALKNNFDLDAGLFLPPGYRTYDFNRDGSVTSEVHLVDDERWPRQPMPRSVKALLNGELTWQQFDEIVARRRRAAQDPASPTGSS